MKKLFLKVCAAVFLTTSLAYSLSAQVFPEEVYHPPGWNEKFVGKPAPKFVMKTPSGSTLSSDELKGKFVVLDFWSTWCKPCKMLTHDLDSALKKYDAGQLQMIAVNHGEKMIKGGKPEQYWAESKYKFPMSINDEYAKKLDAGFPTAVVIGPDGRIISYFTGWTPTTAGEIDAILWERSTRPESNITTITDLNNQGEFVKALYLHDRLVDQHPEQKIALIEQRLRATLQTNPWMGLNIAKEWSKSSNGDKSVMATIGRLIRESKVKEKDILDFGVKATEKSML